MDIEQFHDELGELVANCDANILDIIDTLSACVGVVIATSGTDHIQRAALAGGAAYKVLGQAMQDVEQDA